MEEDNKKKLINETVTGRRITLRRAARYAVIAAVCGAAFGTATILTQTALNSVKTADQKSEASADDRIYQEETDSTDTDASDKQQNQSNSESFDSEDKSENKSNSADTAASETKGSAAESIPNDTAENEELVHAQFKEELLHMQTAAANAANASLVEITATSQTTTWFDSEMENSDVYSGIILSIEDKEILILAPYIEPTGKTFKVGFGNGSTTDAYIKQYSSADGISIIAVSAIDGISSETLSTIDAIKYADTDALQNGTRIAAVGSPLGMIDSCSFGDICYVNKAEMGIDCSQLVFYSDIIGNAAAGTYIIDYSGKLIGIVSADKSEISSDFTRIVSISSLDRIIRMLMVGNKKAYLGVYGIDVDFGMKYSSVPEGVYISEIISGSPAYNAGLRHGDVIIGIADRDIADAAALNRSLNSLKPGTNVEIRIMRSSVNSEYRELKFELVLGER